MSSTHLNPFYDNFESSAHSREKDFRVAATSFISLIHERQQVIHLLPPLLHEQPMGCGNYEENDYDCALSPIHSDWHLQYLECDVLSITMFFKPLMSYSLDH